MSDRFPPPAKPRPVDGGIKARSKRGAIGQTWWSEHFIEVLESIGLGNRLQRGRSYARKGQVIELKLDAGSVTALVQGSRPRPYRTRIGITAFDKTAWAQVEQALAADAWYAAQLLSGQMPEDIEEVFTSVELSLLPADPRDLSLDCSCPDWEVPCKHLAATFYLLAESFDADPFAILAWRGRNRDDLLTNVRSQRTGIATTTDFAEPTAIPLTDCLRSYFAAPAAVPSSKPSQSPAGSLLDELPTIDLDIRGHNIVDLLRPAYHTLANADEGPPEQL